MTCSLLPKLIPRHRQTHFSQRHTLAAPYAREANICPHHGTPSLQTRLAIRGPGPARGTQHGPAEPGASHTLLPEAAAPTLVRRHGGTSPSQFRLPVPTTLSESRPVPGLTAETPVRRPRSAPLCRSAPLPPLSTSRRRCFRAPDCATATSGQLSAHRLTAGGTGACAELAPRAAVSLATAGAAC